jgi:hypothetical protein
MELTQDNINIFYNKQVNLFTKNIQNNYILTATRKNNIYIKKKIYWDNSLYNSRKIDYCNKYMEPYTFTIFNKYKIIDNYKKHVNDINETRFIIKDGNGEIYCISYNNFIKTYDFDKNLNINNIKEIQLKEKKLSVIKITKKLLNYLPYNEEKKQYMIVPSYYINENKNNFDNIIQNIEEGDFIILNNSNKNCFYRIKENIFINNYQIILKNLLFEKKFIWKYYLQKFIDMRYKLHLYK